MAILLPDNQTAFDQPAPSAPAGAVQLQPADQAPAAARRYSGAPVEAIPAGGGWDETFYVRTTLTFKDVVGMESERRRLKLDAEGADLVSDVSLVLWLAGHLLERWTLQHAAASAAEFEKLPSEMTQPVIERVGDFLRKKSAPVK